MAEPQKLIIPDLVQDRLDEEEKVYRGQAARLAVDLLKGNLTDDAADPNYNVLMMEFWSNAFLRYLTTGSYKK